MAAIRRFTLSLDLPVDPWPRASLAERTAVKSVLILLLALPCVAAAVFLVLAFVIIQYVSLSYGLGVAVRDMIDRSARSGKLGEGLPVPPRGAALRGPGATR